MISLRPTQRLAANALLRDGARVLLTRNAPDAPYAGGWTLPGGGLDHGEDPAAAVVRETAEETGLTIAVDRLLSVVHEVDDQPWRGIREQSVRLVYAVRRVGGVLTAELSGSSDLAEFVPIADLDDRPVAPWTREALGLDPGPEPLEPHPPSESDDSTRAEPGGAGPARRQRLAAYALVRHDGAVLLTRLSSRTAAPGRWTLPGGGVDHGEHPAAAVVREVVEETGLAVHLGELLDADSVHFTGTSPRGILEDFHGVRLVWRAHVGTRAEPRVVELDGTTDAAGWFRTDHLAGLPLTRLAERFLSAS